MERSHAVIHTEALQETKYQPDGRVSNSIKFLDTYNPMFHKKSFYCQQTKYSSQNHKPLYCNLNPTKGSQALNHGGLLTFSEDNQSQGKSGKRM